MNGWGEEDRGSSRGWGWGGGGGSLEKFHAVLARMGMGGWVGGGGGVNEESSAVLVEGGGGGVVAKM